MVAKLLKRGDVCALPRFGRDDWRGNAVRQSSLLALRSQHQAVGVLAFPFSAGDRVQARLRLPVPAPADLLAFVRGRMHHAIDGVGFPVDVALWMVYSRFRGARRGHTLIIDLLGHS